MKPCNNLISLVALVGFASLNCLEVSAENLAREDLQSFSLVEKKTSSGKVLHLRAEVTGHSTHSLGPAEWKTEGPELQLRIPKIGRSYIKSLGDLDLFIPIQKSTKVVVFGDNKQQIWPVDSGAPPISSAQTRAKALAVKQYKSDYPASDIDEILVYLGHPHRPDDGVYTVCFRPYSTKAKYAEYIVSTAEDRVLERVNLKARMRYSEPDDQSEWVVLCRYKGYEPQERIDFEHPPVALYTRLECIKGVPTKELRVQYDFADNNHAAKAENRGFSPPQMPKQNSEWILFLVKQRHESDSDTYKTWRGVLGRVPAIGDNLDTVYRTAVAHRGQH